MNEIKNVIINKFKKLFDTEPILVSSPARINLIGEHTDYNDGFVLPASVDKALIFAIAPSKDKNCTVISNDFNESIKFRIDEISKSEKNWANYILGSIDQLQNNYELESGFNCIFGGNIPIGAGMSSSAAVEAGLIFSLNEIFGLGLGIKEIAKLAQKAEHQFIGVNCGIMDQFANLFGKENQLIKLDCRSLDYKYFPFENNNYKIILCNSGVSHSLASSEYNVRRRQCEEGVKIIQSKYPDVKSLRDCNFLMLNELKSMMPEIIFRRCKFVIEENERVNLACEELNRSDFVKVGKLINQSHSGLSKEYEVSCEELDFLAEEAQKVEGVLGSRMMGGGFGGCTINLVEKDSVENFIIKIENKYKRRFNLKLEVYQTQIEDGTKLLKR